MARSLERDDNQAAAMNETLTQLVDKTRTDASNGSSGLGNPTNGPHNSDSVLVMAKHAAFRTFLLLSASSLRSNTLWAIECIIQWLQASALIAASLLNLCVIPKQSLLQLLSFPLSASPVLAWGNTLLASVTSGLYYVSGRALMNNTGQIGGFFAACGITTAVIAALVYLSFQTEQQRRVPVWFVHVRAIVYRCLV
jgi:hypothetical protein